MAEKTNDSGREFESDKETGENRQEDFAQQHKGQQGGGSGFVGSQGEESGEYLQGEQGSKDQNFAGQGRGATDEEDESGESGNSGSF